MFPIISNYKQVLWAAYHCGLVSYAGAEGGGDGEYPAGSRAPYLETICSSSGLTPHASGLQLVRQGWAGEEWVRGGVGQRLLRI